MRMVYAPEKWQGKPIIAILNTWSDLQPCHSHFKARVEDVKRGILMAGGFPVELPAISVSASFVGSSLARLRDGDIVAIDVAARSIEMEVSEEELTARRTAWKGPERRYKRGYGWMFSRHIQQAHLGCDFAFLRTDFGAPVPEPAIY